MTSAHGVNVQLWMPDDGSQTWGIEHSIREGDNAGTAVYLAMVTLIGPSWEEVCWHYKTRVLSSLCRYGQE